MATDRQTDRRTDGGPLHEAVLAVASGGLIIIDVYVFIVKFSKVFKFYAFSYHSNEAK